MKLEENLKKQPIKEMTKDEILYNMNRNSIKNIHHLSMSLLEPMKKTNDDNNRQFQLLNFYR